MKQKEKDDKWTYKLGQKIGEKLSPILSNRKIQIAIIIILLLVLFTFIVPIRNNIVTISILIILIIADVIIRNKTK